jgi:hypothetical protein
MIQEKNVGQVGEKKVVKPCLCEQLFEGKFIAIV